VHGGTGMERVGADAEAAREFDAGFDRLVRRNGDNAVLELTAIMPSWSWSSFFQLSNRDLKVAFPAASKGPPTPAVLPTRAGVIPRRFSSAAVTW